MEQHSWKSKKKEIRTSLQIHFIKIFAHIKRNVILHLHRPGCDARVIGLV